MQVNSASIDHHALEVGVHLVNIHGAHYPLIYEYDLRFVKPLLDSSEKTLTSASMHTIEHLLAYYLRDGLNRSVRICETSDDGECDDFEKLLKDTIEMDTSLKKIVRDVFDDGSIISSSTDINKEPPILEYDEEILSIYPYGCKTGFGCLSTLTPVDFTNHLISTIRGILEKYANDVLEIPFCDTRLCGNIFLNDLERAISDLKDFLSVVERQLKERDTTLLAPPRIPE